MSHWEIFERGPVLPILCCLPALAGWAQQAENAGRPAAPAPRIVELRKIWDRAPHNAFTDLVRFKGQWFCAFREGEGHVSPDGSLRIITSRDGWDWNSAALLTDPNSDLRDPKLAVTPDGRLMLNAAAALHEPDPVRHQTLVWFSANGREWSGSEKIGDPNLWLWRVQWHQRKAYSIGYSTVGERFVRLYRSDNGRNFEALVPELFSEGYPNETSLVFLPDDRALCLLRRDGNPHSAQLGLATPPYTEWRWKDLGVRVGGPRMVRLPDGRIIAAVRLYDGQVRTSLMGLDPDSARLTELLKLPSGGDTSYAGLVWHEEHLWVSYYSSHEGKTSIYLAKIEIQ